MKTKILLTALAVTIAATSFAQQKTSFGIRAGANFQNLTGEDANGNDYENKLKPGFHVGVNAEIPVGVDFYVQPGVLFSQKGAKLDNDDKINISYIEVPVNFLYKPALGTGRLILGFGPYVAFAAGASYKPDGNGDDVDYEFENEVTGAQYITGAYLKRIDAGANLLFGYEMTSNLSVQLNAGLGLLNIQPEISDLPNNVDQPKLKNVGFGLSLGYRF